MKFFFQDKPTLVHASNSNVYKYIARRSFNFDWMYVQTYKFSWPERVIDKLGVKSDKWLQTKGSDIG